MPPLRDAEIIDKFRLALEERNSGGARWKPLPTGWVRKNLEGYTARLVNGLLFGHIAGGGTIDQVEETREDYRHLHKYHYDFRILVLDKLVYVETVLDESKMGPVVTIVNIHYV
jgi:hypothetical protein